MSDSSINAAALRETTRTLAATAGIGESAAAGLLDKHITINAEALSSAAKNLATELQRLLGRTFVSVSQLPSPDDDLEIVIGASQPKQYIRTLFVNWDCESIIISTEPNTEHVSRNLHPLFLLLGACYAAAAATKLITGEAISQPLPDPLIIKLDRLGLERQMLDRPIILSDTYMAGAGAIGNGFLRALRHIDVRGQLHIADDDSVDDTNLQRQIFFDNDDIAKPKATTLATKAQPYFPRLELIPYKIRLQALRSNSDDRWLRRLIVAVDSRRARRELQDEIPGEVFDASTTDIREVIVHYHKQPTTSACMSCIYATDQAEINREVLLASGLGLAVENIQKREIDRHAAEIIIKHLELANIPEDFIGLACDTLFKRLCGEGRLKVSPDKQILAPFAFVSVLAGTLLVIELVRRLASTGTWDDNYWRVSAWSPPIVTLRKKRKRIANCSFCGKPFLLAATEGLWAMSNDDCNNNTTAT